PIMKIIGTTCVAILCAVALFVWHGNNNKNSAAESGPAVEQPLNEKDLDELIENIRADRVACVHWVHPSDTWQRLLATPLGTLVPADVAENISVQLAGVERIEVVIDYRSFDAPPSPEYLREMKQKILQDKRDGSLNDHDFN